MKKPIFAHQDTIHTIIRVDHAGEYGAKRIYEGQLKRFPEDKEIRHMYKQELAHLAYFQQQVAKKRVRPTMLMPLWDKFGFLLGYLTARRDRKTAMICTESVETIIDHHYEDQLNYLKNYDDEVELQTIIKQFQQEEVEHKEVAEEFITSKSIMDAVISKLISNICVGAIFLSKKF